MKTKKYSFANTVRVAGVLTCLVILAAAWWMGIRMTVYNLGDFVKTASDVPTWLVNHSYAVVGDAEILALREGLCKHDPVYIRPKSDGSAVMTCGRPAGSGPVILFTVASLDPTGTTGDMRDGR